jgi:coenzyme F420 hydrogenase subunit delta
MLVLGCGNVLFGDDGFGPAVAQCLQARPDVPEELCIINAGTSVREILFDILLSERRPRRIIILDAMDKGLRPGELFRPSIDAVPLKKLDDFSIHQLPTSNLLRELRDLGHIDVELIACQVQEIPESVLPGLSPPVEDAVSKAAEIVMQEVDLLKKDLVADVPHPS